jgi:hypothetical protein
VFGNRKSDALRESKLLGTACLELLSSVNTFLEPRSWCEAGSRGHPCGNTRNPRIRRGQGEVS